MHIDTGHDTRKHHKHIPHTFTPPHTSFFLQVELIMEKMPNLLTSKPVIYLVNMSATDFTRKKNK